MLKNCIKCSKYFLQIAWEKFSSQSKEGDYFWIIMVFQMKEGFVTLFMTYLGNFGKAWPWVRMLYCIGFENELNTALITHCLHNDKSDQWNQKIWYFDKDLFDV